MEVNYQPHVRRLVSKESVPPSNRRLGSPKPKLIRRDLKCSNRSKTAEKIHVSLMLIGKPFMANGALYATSRWCHQTEKRTILNCTYEGGSIFLRNIGV